MNIQQDVSDMLRLSLAQVRARYVEVIGDSQEPACAQNGSNAYRIVAGAAVRFRAMSNGDAPPRDDNRKSLEKLLADCRRDELPGSLQLIEMIERKLAEMAASKPPPPPPPQ